MPKKLSLSPILFNWTAEKRRDFYFEVADSEIDIVYIGEVVCPKRQQLAFKYIDETVKRLKDANKEVIVSTMAIIFNEKADKCVNDAIAYAEKNGLLIEANDISTFAKTKGGKNTVIGPFLNIYNEETLRFFNNVRRACLPFELSVERANQIAEKTDKELEIFAWGRIPLAISARCFHAKINNLKRSECGLVCGKDLDGLDIKTLDNQDFLSVSGPLTLSHRYKELSNFKDISVEIFRISPHNINMKNIITKYKTLIQQGI